MTQDAGALLKQLADDVVREMHSVLTTKWDRDCLRAKTLNALYRAQAASQSSGKVIATRTLNGVDEQWKFSSQGSAGGEAVALRTSEKGLLEWLQKGDGQYGECQGDTLNDLIGRGFVVVHGEDSGLNNGFIAKGTDIMYRAVSITDAGRAALSPPVKTGGEERTICNCGVMCQDLGKDAGCRYMQPARQELRKLVDIVYKHAADCVPMTDTSDKLIDEVFGPSLPQLTVAGDERTAVQRGKASWPTMSWWEAASLNAEFVASLGEWKVTFKSPRGVDWRDAGIALRERKESAPAAQALPRDRQVALDSDGEPVYFAQAVVTRDMLANAIDSLTVGALADVFGKNAKLAKSYSEQIVDILLPRLASPVPSAECK